MDLKVEEGVPEAQFQQMTENSFPPLPGKTTAVGDTWSKEVRSDLPQVGTLVLTTEFTYQGTEERDGETCFKITSTFQAHVEKAEGSRVEVTATLDPEISRGVTYISRETGFAVAAESTMKLTMDLEIEGSELKQVVETTMTATGLD